MPEVVEWANKLKIPIGTVPLKRGRHILEINVDSEPSLMNTDYVADASLGTDSS